jgi:hypothetical protein
MEGCQCTGYWEKLIPDSDEDGELELEEDDEPDNGIFEDWGLPIPDKGRG